MLYTPDTISRVNSFGSFHRGQLSSLAMRRPVQKVNKGLIQRECSSCKEEELQMKSFPASSIQMQPIEEEELLQPKLRLQPIEEEEELLQPKLRMQPIEEEEEMLQLKIQKQVEEEEEVLQMQPLEEEEEMIQPIIQRQEEEQAESEQEEEGMTFEEIGQAISETFLRHPPTLSGFCVNRANEIEEFLLKMTAGSRYYSTVEGIFSGFFNLALDLSNTESETSEEQRSRYTELQTEWEDVQQAIENHSIAKIKRDLQDTRHKIEEMKLQLVLVYRQVYLSGEDSTIEIVISETSEDTTTLRDITDQVTGLLSAINEADAALTARQVAPLLTLLSRVSQFLNLILGWNFTGELDSESQSALDDLQNGLAVVITAASFTAVAAYLPLFGHIPVLLGAISKQFDQLVEIVRQSNTIEWELRGKITNCSEEPGGCETLNYMISVFETSSYEEVVVPSEEVGDFFLDRREMFNTVANEVMESTWDVPTEQEYLFFTVIDDDRFKGWVYFNREWIWRLIYGDRSFPKTKK